MMHKCFVPDAPYGYIKCICVRGQDHDEAQSDIPTDEDDSDDTDG